MLQIVGEIPSAQILSPLESSWTKPYSRRLWQRTSRIAVCEHTRMASESATLAEIYKTKIRTMDRLKVVKCNLQQPLKTVTKWRGLTRRLYAPRQNSVISAHEITSLFSTISCARILWRLLLPHRLYSASSTRRSSKSRARHLKASETRPKKGVWALLMKMMNCQAAQMPQRANRARKET